ncbi:hypothetical protein Tco_0003273 [Tanacetum coccineum]
MFMTIQSNVKDKLLATSSETSKVENARAEMLRNLDQQMEKRVDDVLLSILKWMDKSGSMIQTLEDIMRPCVIDFGGSYQLSIRCASFEALYGRKCRSPVLWAEIGESSLIGPELVPETIDKVVLIKEKLKAVRDRQKSYADNRRKPLEFKVGDQVMLKVSPWEKGLLCLSVTVSGHEWIVSSECDHLIAVDSVNSSNHLSQCWQDDFNMYMYYDPENYRRDLLKYLDILVDLLHQSVLRYGKLRMHEGKVKAIKKTGIWLNKATLHENANEKSFKLESKDVKINPVQAVNVDLVVTESGGTDSDKHDTNLVVTESGGTDSDKQDSSSSLGNYLTYDVNADIRPVNDQVPFAEYYKNADLKAQIQEKVFANAALKNELQKLKGNSVDTRFVKASILGKPHLQPSRNHSVVRQPNAFKSERNRISKPRFASQVDVKHNFPKLVIPYYLPNFREFSPAKPHHVNAPSSSMNCQKESCGSNDMAHNHFQMSYS